MKELIEKIKEGVTITIKGNSYVILSKTYYLTDINNSKYIKVVLSGHIILVISDSDNYICFGKELENPMYEIIDDSKLKYNGNVYNKVVDDYQRIEEIEFGDLSIVEGELQYSDYESEDGKRVLSLTVDHKSDTLLELINLQDIII